jgi:hypothetical protein
MAKAKTEVVETAEVVVEEKVAKAPKGSSKT